MRLGTAAATAVAAVLLAACGGGDTVSELEIAEGSPTSSEPAATASPGATIAPDAAAVPSPRPAPEQGESVPEEINVWTLGLPEDGAARDAAEALVSYMEARLGAYHAQSADLAALARVAAGPPLTDIQGQVIALGRRGLRTVGDLWITVAEEDVRVRGGRRATLEGVCMRNATVDVDRRGIAQESPPDAYRVRATVAKAGPGTWVVDGISFESTDRC